MTIEKFKIGDEILVHCLAVRVTDDSMYPAGSKNFYVTWRNNPVEINRVGWYVGFTYRYNGLYIPSHQSPYDGDYDPAYLQVKDTVKLARVRFNPRENERLAFFSSIDSVKELEQWTSFMEYCREGNNG